MGCFNSVVVAAPADKVWAALRQFHDISWSANVITSVESEGDPELAGAKRLLNGVFFETLLSLDDDTRVLRYSIDDGPAAVSKDNVTGYVGEVSVQPVTDDDSTFVIWSSSWDTDGGGVEDFCNPIYRALLNDLKQHFA
jgi:carbon monoxide dehydrogenase subunit G